MTLATACAPLIAFPVAWALLGLKRLLPGSPDRRYRYILLRFTSEPQQPRQWEQKASRAPIAMGPDAADISWLPLPNTRHEHYVH